MKFDFMFLEQLCAAPTELLMEALTKQLQSCYTEVRSTSDYVIAFGEIPIALVAHADTVWLNPPQEIYYDVFKRTCLTLGQGAGFDDRAGIYAIWKIVEALQGPNPTIIITTGEEKCGIGAQKLAQDMGPKGIKYFIELDRAGKDDCVFYYCDNNDFRAYIESFGFHTKEGSYTDISFLMDKWKVCGVNLSIGYYNEHSDYEFLYVDYLSNTIDKVLKMLREEEIPNFVFKKREENKDGSKRKYRQKRSREKTC